MLFEKIEAAGLSSASIEWIDLDMSSMNSVSSFAKKILNKNVPISLLINNGMLTKEERSSTCKYVINTFLNVLSIFSGNYVCSIQRDQRWVWISVCCQLFGPFSSNTFVAAPVKISWNWKSSGQDYKFIIFSPCFQMVLFWWPSGKVCFEWSFLIMYFTKY